jgi:hypothetical protein
VDRWEEIDMPNAALPPGQRNKLLTLHHELLYPAFLGAALVEFAERVAKDGIDWSSVPWLVSALWFLLYFSVAFLALAEADDDTKRGAFRGGAFAANLAEIAVILLVSVFIEQVDTSTKVHVLRYWLIYLSWIAIPLTGSLSNNCSGRTVHIGLSYAAGTAGAVGLLLLWAEASTIWYWAILTFMYVLLGIYYRAVFWGTRLWLDVPPADGNPDVVAP